MWHQRAVTPSCARVRSPATFPPTLFSRAQPSGRGPHTARSALPGARSTQTPGGWTGFPPPSSERPGPPRPPAAESHRGTPRGPNRFLSERFHVLLNSLFKVLFNVPSRYLFSIGLAMVFSLRWSLPPALGCILKQPDSWDRLRGGFGRPYGADTLYGPDRQSRGFRPP